MTQNRIGPSNSTTALPISAPYSSCRSRIDSGDPSKPDRFATSTTGQIPLAARMARAALREEFGNSVPLIHTAGPSGGPGRRRGIGWDSMPTKQTGCPFIWPCIATVVSPPAMSAHRSSSGASWSLIARITSRIANGFLRPGLVASETTSPIVAKPPGPL